jgi:polynucleotide 5'-hydroxyl-kinase GRC3/NOL9
VALHFVGTTSPAANLLGALAGTRRMLDRARAAGFQRVVVDTSGLVAGRLGRVLKQAKIELTDPDVLLCLERTDECDHIVGGYAAGARPAVLRLPASAQARARSAEDRRRHREQRLHAYFAGARPLALDLGRVVVRAPGGEPWGPRHVVAGLPGILAGLEDRTRATLGLGVVRGIDVDQRVIHIHTGVREAEVAAVVLGRETYPA